MILINKFRYIPIFKEVLTKTLQSNEYILKLLDRIKDDIYYGRPNIKTNTQNFEQLILLGCKGLNIQDADTLHDTIFGTTNVAATGDIADMMEYKISHPLRPVQIADYLIDLVWQLDRDAKSRTLETEEIYKLILATAMVTFKGQNI